MKRKTKLLLLACILSIFTTFPISMYLQYKILQAINATELMWFLYILYIPLAIFVTIIMKIAEAQDD